MSRANVAKKNKMIDTMCAQKYGSERTIGPRQTAVIVDVLRMNILGLNCTRDRLLANHPVASIDMVLTTLRMRGLVKQRKVRGRGYEVTASGFEIGQFVLRSNIATGLGVVATNVRQKRD